MPVPFARSAGFHYALLVLVCGGMVITPLVNHFRRDVPFPWPAYEQGIASHNVPLHKQNKDYPLWYYVGRVVVEDSHLRTADGGPWPLYPTAPNAIFPFMYPPFAALCLGALSLLGPTGMLLVLLALNVVSVAVAVELSVRLVAGTGNVSPWLRIVPSAVCLFFLNDMFMLGQPNLGLLCLVLGGLTLTRSGKRTHAVAAGGLFALATALKAFPAVVIVYLLWRRQWAAAASMVLFGLLFFVAVPATVRGWDRSLGELKTWADGMLGRQGEQGSGQRPEQSVGWRNQSLLGVGHRFLRPANARAEETAGQTVMAEQAAALAGATAPATFVRTDDWPGKPLYVNLLNLDYRGAMIGTVAIAGLLGIGFIVAMPKRAARTRGTDAAEFAALVTLMTIGTPYAFGYYFVWLLVPLTVLVHRGMQPGGWPAWVAAVVVVAGFAAGGLSAFRGAVPGAVLPMACGALFWAAAGALAGCGWVMLSEANGRRRVADGA